MMQQFHQSNLLTENVYVNGSISNIKETMHRSHWFCYLIEHQITSAYIHNKMGSLMHGIQNWGLFMNAMSMST